MRREREKCPTSISWTHHPFNSPQPFTVPLPGVAYRNPGGWGRERMQSWEGPGDTDILRPSEGFCLYPKFSSVRFSSIAHSSPTLFDPVDCSIPGFHVYHQLLELTQTHVHWVSDAIQTSHLLSSPLLPPSIFPSISIFSNESVLRIKWPKYWSFSFSISPSNEYSRLSSFRIDWLDLLVVQGTLKSLLQHHSSKASILQHSVFFIVQLSHPYMTMGKIIALTRWTFVAKSCLCFLICCLAL